MDAQNPLPEAPTPPQPPVVARDPLDVEQNKDLAAFSYTWVMSVFMLLFKHKSPFVHFHARQATVLFILSIIVWFIPYVGRLLEVFIFIGFAWGFINAAQGKWEEVPFAGPLARGRLSIRGSWKHVVAGVLVLLNEARHVWHKHGHRPDAPAVPPVPAPPADRPAPKETPPAAATDSPLSP